MQRIELRYGLLMLLGFISYFFLMKAFGLYTNIGLRVFNVLIHGAFVYLAMRAYRKASEGNFSFLDTFAVGFRTSILPVLGFAVFQFIYLNYLNVEFLAVIKQTNILGDLLNPFNASAFLVIEGLGVTLLTSYVGMRYLTVQEDVPPVS